MVLFPGLINEPVESRMLTEKDAMDSIVLITCDACCTIQLLCHTLPPRIIHFNYLWGRI
jgi:hypothetical protein